MKGRKRPREVRDSANPVPTERPGKRPRSLPAPQRTHISHWVEQKTWPKEYFEQDSMHHLIARQKSTASLRRQRSEPSLTPSTTPSDQRPREEKSAPYRNPTYPTLLETLGDSFMDESELGITDASKVLYQNLLETECTTPKDTLFRDVAVFKRLVATFATKTRQKLSKTLVDYSFPPQKPLRHLAPKTLVS